MAVEKLFFGKKGLPKPFLEEELNKLFYELKEGSKEAREKLIVHNLRLVLYEVINKFSKTNYDIEDLVSLGNIGLIKAIDSYDISKGIKFVTYATRCIDNEILMFLRKNKKDYFISSMNSVIYTDKNGSEIKLEDILSDDKDLVEDYERTETYAILREIIEHLPERDKEIVMMYFGFYDNHLYTGYEIGVKLGISQSYVSRLIAKILIKIRNQLEGNEKIKNYNRSMKKRKEKKNMKRIQTIYEYFSEYTREQVNTMLTMLSEEERALVTLRYGEDLDNPIQTKLTSKERVRFYNHLIPKMRRILFKLYGKSKKEESKQKERKDNIEQDSQDNDELVQEQIVFPLGEKEKLLPDEKSNELSNGITKNDCVKMLEILRTSTFTQMMSVLTPKESIIISLRLGYVDGKCFSIESIAQFLEISEEEVREATKKVLLLYKENINSFLDSVIEMATNLDVQDKVLSIDF